MQVLMCEWWAVGLRQSVLNTLPIIVRVTRGQVSKALVLLIDLIYKSFHCFSWALAVNSTFAGLILYERISKIYRALSELCSVLIPSGTDLTRLRQTQRFLWLPPEYRVCTAAVCGHMVCLGYISGRIALLSLQ